MAANEASISSFPTQEPHYIDLRTCSFSQAASTWLESRRAYISAKTLHEYEINIRTLSPVFGEMRLEEITADQIRDYQRMRQAKCGPFAINHECSVLQQMLKRIGRWPSARPRFSFGKECSFDTRPETLKQLQSPGVPETVILAMVRAG
jgi:hypothetical protein